MDAGLRIGRHLSGGRRRDRARVPLPIAVPRLTPCHARRVVAGAGRSARCGIASRGR